MLSGSIVQISTYANHVTNNADLHATVLELTIAPPANTLETGVSVSRNVPRTNIKKMVSANFAMVPVLMDVLDRSKFWVQKDAIHVNWLLWLTTEFTNVFTKMIPAQTVTISNMLVHSYMKTSI